MQSRLPPSTRVAPRARLCHRTSREHPRFRRYCCTNRTVGNPPQPDRTDAFATPPVCTRDGLAAPGCARSKVLRADAKCRGHERYTRQVNVRHGWRRHAATATHRHARGTGGDA